MPKRIQCFKDGTYVASQRKRSTQVNGCDFSWSKRKDKPYGNAIKNGDLPENQTNSWLLQSFLGLIKLIHVKTLGKRNFLATLAIPKANPLEFPSKSHRFASILNCLDLAWKKTHSFRKGTKKWRFLMDKPFRLSLLCINISIVTSPSSQNAPFPVASSIHARV